MSLLQFFHWVALYGFTGYMLYGYVTLVRYNQHPRVAAWRTGMVIAWESMKFSFPWIFRGIFFGVRGWAKWCLQPEFIVRSRRGE